MDSAAFIVNFKEIFDFDIEEDGTVVAADTSFKDLEDWDSLAALSLIAMVDEKYGVNINGDDIRGVTTIKDLLDLVNSRK